MGFGLLVALEEFLRRRQGWGQPPNEAAAYPLRGEVQDSEIFVWAVPLLMNLGAVVFFWYQFFHGETKLDKTTAYSAAVPVLLFELGILGALYLLDRFYYYKLLLGAVNRARDLEEVLGFRLSTAITDLTSPRQSAVVVTLV